MKYKLEAFKHTLKFKYLENRATLESFKQKRIRYKVGMFPEISISCEIEFNEIRKGGKFQNLQCFLALFSS